MMNIKSNSARVRVTSYACRSTIIRIPFGALTVPTATRPTPWNIKNTVRIFQEGRSGAYVAGCYKYVSESRQQPLYTFLYKHSPPQGPEAPPKVGCRRTS